MSIIIKPLSNTINLTGASNCFRATAVLITNDATQRTITLANTAAPNEAGDNGNYPGGSLTVRIAANESIIIRKRPNDTVAAASGVYATRVADTGN